MVNFHLKNTPLDQGNHVAVIYADTVCLLHDYIAKEGVITFSFPFVNVSSWTFYFIIERSKNAHLSL